MPAAKLERRPGTGHGQIALHTKALTCLFVKNPNGTGPHLSVPQVSIFYKGQFHVKLLELFLAIPTLSRDVTNTQ